MISHGIGMTSQRTRERLVARLRAEGITDARVLRAMTEVPRHLFVDEALASRAYEDNALPIGYSQTISQPYIVARMTELVLRNNPSRVLEIGTGSGYQAAVLARLVAQVYSVERIAALFQRARRRLAEQGIGNVTIRLGDGSLGWPEQAPFDVILVTAGAGDVPDALMAQLTAGGQIIIPVGYDRQTLTVVHARGSGKETEQVETVSFVPLLTGVE